ncbi:helix-turn-helix domain-containing protein [Pseudomonas helleri]|uniref:replication/maintenance protein RepL n=1 Tax=Pseudomonas helleri TaxID=1608996 RepID=UPI0012955025|nr:replication/maintenance protein RepL [Pseudomonas helleri]MQT35104.1 hypothetical protein [Pseudomonas helleri]
MSKINNQKKVVYENNKTIVNDKGEVIQETSETVSRMPNEPNFVKIYIDGISKIYNLSNGENSFLFELLKLVNYDNEIVLNKGIKQKIAARIGIKSQTVDNNISKLKKSKIIVQTQFRGIYMISPEIFGKGAWSEVYKYRAKYQKLCISIEIDNETKDIKNAKIDIKRVDDNEKIEKAAKEKNQTTDEFIHDLEKIDIDNIDFI